jgi:hypothetical protein
MRRLLDFFGTFALVAETPIASTQSSRTRRGNGPAVEINKDLPSGLGSTTTSRPGCSTSRGAASMCRRR